MTRSGKLLLVLGFGWALSLGLAACSDPDATPPQILYGSDECSNCRMIISDERFAAAARTLDGRELRYDGIGCMLTHRSTEDPESASVWVHDFSTGEWITVEAASFARDVAGTPMGSGFVATRAGSSVPGAVDELIDWDELREVAVR